MTHNRVWFHFEFADHSNPYIAIRTDTFWFMVQRYYLTQIGEKNFYVEGMRETSGKHPFTREVNKAILQSFAQDWQRNFEHFNYSYQELADWQTFFEEYGRKYGLLREFRENGII